MASRDEVEQAVLDAIEATAKATAQAANSSAASYEDLKNAATGLRNAAEAYSWLRSPGQSH